MKKIQKRLFSAVFSFLLDNETVSVHLLDNIQRFIVTVLVKGHADD